MPVNSVVPVDASTGRWTNTANGSSVGEQSSTANDKSMFLNLLVTQLRYQDPMNPTDSSEFMAQTAQFQSLEVMQDVASQLSALQSSQMAFGASSLVGRTVSYADPADPKKTLTGTVNGVSFEATGPVLDVAGTKVPMLNVVSVTDGSTPTPPTTPGTSA
ncbi:flagellar hook assembly protein FlgD [Aeromicrobium massiliense]|uniref:flagellar hook assembly protein FlgD n=1 Tax=Aeromicrobium massiliense TaxID=1464554 RepID=UPI0002DB4918|nr:flagellar hook capping FlgD N-terminal domain-containing protein [Aeromicrobium massiliense]